MSARVLVSAGEASGDLYASAFVRALRGRYPNTEFFGCTGPRMRAAGVETVIDAASLSVVGLLEVVTHIPRIYGEYRKLLRVAKERRPEVAILTDSPDFHLRIAKQLKKLGIPVVYLVAPQVWAWRKGRLKLMRRVIDRLLCIFPFEEQYFSNNGIPTSYIGHPLTRLVRASAPPSELRRRFGIPENTRLIALLPGSRGGEIARHWPILLKAVKRLTADPAAGNPLFVLALPAGTKFREPISIPAIKVLEGQTWDVLACADLALAASGTVTIEAALLNTPMVTFYRVNALSWLLGKLLVRVPFYSMANLVAERRIVPELIQSRMTSERLAAESIRLLNDEAARMEMKAGLAAVAQKLSGREDPMQVAVVAVSNLFEEEFVHVT